MIQGNMQAKKDQEDQKKEQKRNLAKIHIDPEGNARTNTIDDELLAKLPFDTQNYIRQDKTKSTSIIQNELDASILDSHIDRLTSIYHNCNICFRNCQVNRIKGERGFCGNGEAGFIYSSQLTYGEEKLISPTYEIYFSGCNINCDYCHQKNEMNDLDPENRISFTNVIEDIQANVNKINTISFLGGNPDQSLLAIIKLIKELEEKIKLPYALNSNFLFSSSVRDILDDVFDLYIADFKFGNNKCAYKIAKTHNYIKIVKENIIKVNSLNPIIIRHLPLQGHYSCCTKPILDWMESNLNPDNYVLSLLPSLYTKNDKVLNKVYNYAKNKKITIID